MQDGPQTKLALAKFLRQTKRDQYYSLMYRIQIGLVRVRCLEVKIEIRTGTWLHGSRFLVAKSEFVAAEPRLKHGANCLAGLGCGLVLLPLFHGLAVAGQHLLEQLLVTTPKP